MLNSNEFWGIFMQYLLQGDSYPARQLSNDPCTENVFRVDMIEASHFPCTLFLWKITRKMLLKSPFKDFPCKGNRCSLIV